MESGKVQYVLICTDLRWTVKFRAARQLISSHLSISQRLPQRNSLCTAKMRHIPGAWPYDLTLVAGSEERLGGGISSVTVFQ